MAAKRLVLYRLPAADVPSAPTPVPIYNIDAVGEKGLPLIPEGYKVISHTANVLDDGDVLFSFLIERRSFA